MKQLILVLMLFTAIPTLAQNVYVAPQIELGAGISDFYEDYELNPGLGIGFLLGIGVANRFAIEGDVAFLYWFADEPDNFDITYYEIPFYLGINFRLGNAVGLMGGLGGVYQYYKTELDLGFASPETDDSETNFSFYAGLDVSVDRLVLRPKFVWIDAETDTWSLQLAVGYKIGM